jgi:hypothetical protein
MRLSLRFSANSAVESDDYLRIIRVIRAIRGYFFLLSLRARRMSIWRTADPRR